MRMPLYKFAVIFMILLFSISCTSKAVPAQEPVIHQESSMAHREVAVEMTEIMEMHHWLAYWDAKEQDAIKVKHHVSAALALAKDPRHRSDLDGLIREHISEEHFIHTQKTLKEWLGARPEPEMPLERLEVKLALALLKERKVDDARTHVQIGIASGRQGEAGEKVLNSLTQGNVEHAQRLLAELMEKGPF